MKSRLGIAWGTDFKLARVTVFYEDLQAAFRANALIECPCYWNEPAADMETEFWRFDFLVNGNQKKAAVRMAERSRLVVLSARNQNSIQPVVADCIDAWLKGRSHQPGAFALLFAESNSVSRNCRSRIADWWRVAKQQGMKFYCDLPEWQSDFLFGPQNMTFGGGPVPSSLPISTDQR